MMGRIEINAKLGLKPCPFCGKEISPMDCERSSEAYNAVFKVTCSECGMEFTYREKYEHITERHDGLGQTVVYDRMEATNPTFEDAWNRRTTNE